MASLTPPLATIGILSVGDMGVGIARLLTANNYRVVTNASDRSEATQNRARQNNVELLPNDIELCNAADYILSIVPPSDAYSTAQRISNATTDPAFQPRKTPLYFLDLNAISPSSSRHIAQIFTTQDSPALFIDGSIIGNPPKQNADDTTWTLPSIPTSGPHALSAAPQNGAHLAKILNTTHITPTISSASGLKMCFSALSKGFTALAIASLTTAHNLNCIPELQQHLETFNPGAAKAINSVTRMPPKAYRWVYEMQEIARTFEEEGGFVEGESMFRAIAGVYELVAEGTELGKERTGERARGESVEDVAVLMSEGARRRKEKTE